MELLPTYSLVSHSTNFVSPSTTQIGATKCHCNLPNPLLACLSLTQTKIEYSNRAGGGGNIVWEITNTNEVHTERLKTRSKKSCIHPFGHHNWTRITFGKPWF